MLETTTDINANDAAAVLQPINSCLGDFVDKVYKRGGQEGGAQRRRPEERRHMKAKEDDQRLLQACLGPNSQINGMILLGPLASGLNRIPAAVLFAYLTIFLPRPFLRL